jgi:hypothetical protein
MAFIKIVEFRTTRFEERTPAVEAWARDTEGKRTVQRSVLGRDRNDPDHYISVLFFDSYEAAVENMDLPESQVLVQKLGELSDGAPTIYDLDVIDDRP